MRTEAPSTIPLIPGVNIGDWWNCGYLSNAMPGILRPNLSKEVGTYVAAWENPFPEKEIKTMDFLSASCPDANTINFDPSKTPVPVLIAATGERANPAPLAIDTAEKPGRLEQRRQYGQRRSPAGTVG